MYWSATGKSAYFSPTVWNDLKKWQMNLWWQDQTREKTNRRALYCIYYAQQMHPRLQTHKQNWMKTWIRTQTCIRRRTVTTNAVRHRRNERRHLMKDWRINDDISVPEPLPAWSRLHICYVDGQLTWDLGAGTGLSRGGGERSHNTLDNVARRRGGAASRAAIGCYF